MSCGPALPDASSDTGTEPSSPAPSAAGAARWSVRRWSRSRPRAPPEGPVELGMPFEVDTFR